MRAAFDSNVLLYFASSDKEKAAIAEKLLAQGGTISVQVLNEIANVTRRKMAFTWAETLEFLEIVKALLIVIPVTRTIHEHGLTLAQRYRLSLYDAMITAMAFEAKCNILYSEDMHDGLVIEGPDGHTIRVVNPFKNIH